MLIPRINDAAQRWCMNRKCGSGSFVPERSSSTSGRTSGRNIARVRGVLAVEVLSIRTRYEPAQAQLAPSDSFVSAGQFGGSIRLFRISTMPVRVEVFRFFESYFGESYSNRTTEGRHRRRPNFRAVRGFASVQHAMLELGTPLARRPSQLASTILLEP